VILATVGTQLPFPRLLRALDGIAGRHSLRIVAQTCGSTPTLMHLEQHAFLKPAEFDRILAEATLLVGHAGTGTIFAAAQASKPLIVMPRQFSLGEHRNDHQVATARAFENRPGIHVAWNDEELERLVLTPDLPPLRFGHWPGRDLLLDRVRSFLDPSADR
jgi:UDP-N-acetylglucosamine transferase subunit ALG13